MKTLSVNPDSTKSEESKQIVKAMYEAGVSGDSAGFFGSFMRMLRYMNRHVFHTAAAFAAIVQLAA
jgi:hypothetical protein